VKAKRVRKNKQTARGIISPEAGVECLGPADFAKLRQGIVNLVCHQALEAVDQMMEQVRAGNVQAMKYLFEVAGLFPAASAELSEGADSMTKQLLCYLESSKEAAESERPCIAGNGEAGAVK
jgi:hypothetical protein